MNVLSEAVGAPTGGGTEATEVDGRSNAPVNILLVDDDARNLSVLESVLTSPEYRLVCAEGADAALRALVNEEFALLVLDVRMPDISGLELAQIIKKRRKTRHLPIIFLTAYYQEDDHILQGYGAGAVDYLNKPCNPAVLRSKVAVFANLFRANRALEEEIAERRQAEARLADRTHEVQQLVYQLRALATELTQVEQRERRRIAGILHDHIQQLLVSAKMHVSSLASEPLSDRTRTVVHEIDGILKEAISASRSVTVELSPPILQEAGLAAALQWLARRMLEMNRFSVEIDADEDAEPRSDEHRFLLFECARELLFNAFKHAGVSSAHVQVTQSDDAWITMTVTDRGCGVDAADLRRRTSDHATFGLFSIQQRLVHIGGSLDIETSPGRGMRITIRTPRGEPVDARAKAVEPQSRQIPLDIQGHRKQGTIEVLIVDDHRIMRQGLVGLLSEESDICVVGEAESGQQALDLVDRLNPHVVLMDVNLGEVSGLQITKMIAARKPDVRVVGLSMHEGVDIANAMKKAGAAAYLTKSVASTQLVTTIREVALGVDTRESADTASRGDVPSRH